MQDNVMMFGPKNEDELETDLGRAEPMSEWRGSH